MTNESITTELLSYANPNSNNYIDLPYQTPVNSGCIEKNPTRVFLPDYYNGRIMQFTLPYSINPPLPTGLSMDVTTGVISGTPTEATNGFNTYNVIAYNNCYADTAIVNIRTCVAPEVTVDPIVPATFCTESGSISLSITASNATSYIWLKNGEPVSNNSVFSGAPTSTKTISNQLISESRNLQG